MIPNLYSVIHDDVLTTERNAIQLRRQLWSSFVENNNNKKNTLFSMLSILQELQISLKQIRLEKRKMLQ